MNGKCRTLNFFWHFIFSMNLKRVFKDYVPLLNFFCIFQKFFCIIECHWCTWNCGILDITNVFQIIWKVVIVCRFIACRKSKLCFLMTNFCFPSSSISSFSDSEYYSHSFCWQTTVSQPTVQPSSESSVSKTYKGYGYLCSFFYLVFCQWKWNCPYFSMFVYIGV